MYPHLSMPFKFVAVRARRSSSRTRTPSSPTNRMQFDHIASDTSHGAWIAPGRRAVIGRSMRHPVLELRCRTRS